MHRHVCDASCVCPVHELTMMYDEIFELHACPDYDCEFAHGAWECLCQTMGTICGRCWGLKWVPA